MSISMSRDIPHDVVVSIDLLTRDVLWFMSNYIIHQNQIESSIHEKETYGKKEIV